MKNILIVSDDFFTDLGDAMWRINTNYTVIKCTDFKNYDFRKYIKANPSIVLTRSKDLENETPVKFAEFLNEYNIRLIVFPQQEKERYTNDNRYVSCGVARRRTDCNRRCSQQRRPRYLYKTTDE